MSQSKKPTRVSPPTPRMRALFREAARDIIGRDRDARRSGRTQNTIGEIERAMVKAYRLGQEALLDEPKASDREEGLDWLEIPSRARDTLEWMTSRFSQRLATHLPDPHLNDRLCQPYEIESFEEEGRKRWVLVHDGRRPTRSVADGSVAPLVRLGLLASLPDNPARLALTERGLAMARDYWRRSDANDPTLPRISLRG